MIHSKITCSHVKQSSKFEDNKEIRRFKNITALYKLPRWRILLHFIVISTASQAHPPRRVRYFWLQLTLQLSSDMDPNPSNSSKHCLTAFEPHQLPLTAINKTGISKEHRPFPPVLWCPNEQNWGRLYNRTKSTWHKLPFVPKAVSQIHMFGTDFNKQTKMGSIGY